jgi:hypothetical protein
MTEIVVIVVRALNCRLAPGKFLDVAHACTAFRCDFTTRVMADFGLVLDAVRRGVLCTRLALAIGGLSLWLGLEPGRKFALPLGLLFV